MIPELLAPAGDLNKLKVALIYGADAVYCGLPNFSLRHRENDFSLTDLRKAVELTHVAKKKIYFTVNTYPRDNEFAKLERFLKQIKKTPPDAFIVSDLGVLSTIKEILPKVPLHLSVQANTVNSRTVREWGKLGVKRIILARELSLKEIQKIVKANPRMEFETFVHGAICMSYSGRCLLSMYLSERDANRGKCTQPCRWQYRLEEEKRQGEYFPVEEDEQGTSFANDVPGDKQYFLEEEKRKGELFPIKEDRHGSYILNSKDLCLIEKIPQLAKAGGARRSSAKAKQRLGICSFKIEGRNKTVGYLATIIHAYRRAIDDFRAGKKFDQKLWREIYSTGNREFTLGFFDGSLQNLQNYQRSAAENPQSFLGLVEKIRSGDSPISGSFALLKPKNRFQKGAKIEAVIPQGQIKRLEVLELRDEKFEKIEVAHGGQKGKVWVKLREKLPSFTLLRKC